ncbi:cytochrome c maturation protein CcmE [uncultured Algimonas sp.]|uniref:cytochrome c maturation protein CcmE n=1 Tax=uncultured Algimonas sp. TaxID=1547920 RepID=UPI0026234FCA|nr:cytochrome c maturation protein CcmE [uncultured Algimonas sp.]
MTPPTITPPRRNRRLGLIALVGVGLALGVTLILSALSDNTQFFYNPADVMAKGFVPQSETFRIGGLVAEGSIARTGITTTFNVEDFERPMPTPIKVTHNGQLPNLFREGQGVVVSGRMIGETEFYAEEVLAKHDENYQPKIDYQDEIAS